ncbi:hypothetical protein ABT297_01400 [Dactylosporangium sp. NPDC000555]|uniref:hypothetical protein n=1 Tax=Dactylosporangium sp. NPDC000555 TaxID=3154260 RepID=UPI0033310548
MKARRIAMVALALVAAGALAGCLPDSGTVTSKRSSFNPSTKQWTYVVEVDGTAHTVPAGEYLTCDVGDKVVNGECK